MTAHHFGAKTLIDLPRKTHTLPPPPLGRMAFDADCSWAIASNKKKPNARKMSDADVVVARQKGGDDY